MARLDDTPYAGSAMEFVSDSVLTAQSESAVSEETTEATETATEASTEDPTETTTEAPKATWDFTIHYVGEDSYTDVTKTDDFSLKYQYEFHSEGGIFLSVKQ